MMKYPKAKPLRDEGYRRLVASLPCVWCGIEGHSQAAHANFGKGMAMKASDTEMFPLCGSRPGVVGCHYLLDNLVKYTRDQRRDRESRWAEETRSTLRKLARHDARTRDIVSRSIGLDHE